MGLYHGDNLAVLRGMEAGSVDLIYADPPFCTGRDFGAFDDRWTDAGADGIAAVARRYHSPAMAGYLAFMEPRLRECRRVLRDTGSIYLHCDPTANYYLRLLMDDVFGTGMFRNEIVWCYTGPSSAKRDFPGKHDTLLRYSVSGKWTFNSDDVRVPYTDLHSGGFGMTESERQRYLQEGKLPESWWVGYTPVGRIEGQRTGYPTQKPIKLLQRIVKASSNPGDVVLDPFCGSGTTLVAAQSLSRRWVGIDRNREACEIAGGRLSTMFETVEVQAA